MPNPFEYTSPLVDVSGSSGPFVKLDQTTPQYGTGNLNFQGFIATGGAGGYDYYGNNSAYFGMDVQGGSFTLLYGGGPVVYGITNIGVATFAKTLSPLYDMGTTAYASQYPPAYNSTYVRPTTTYSGGGYEAYYVANPASTLTGVASGNAWFTNSARGNQRLNFDIGSAQVIKRIYYENFHSSGDNSNAGVKDFILQGSNNYYDFSDAGYAAAGTWVDISTDQSTFDQHAPFNQTDKKFIDLTNTTAYRYWSIKCVINYGSTQGVGIRHVEFQTASQPGTPTLSIDSDGRKLYGADGSSLMLDYSEIGFIKFGQNVVLSQQIAGSEVANSSMSLQGTMNATKTTSKLLLQPYGGVVGFATDLPLIPFHIANPVDAGAMTLGSPTGPTFGIAGDASSPYGMYMGRDTNSGRCWIQVGRTDGNTSAYGLNLQPSGGNVGIGLGAVTPSYLLHIVNPASSGTPLCITNPTANNTYSLFETTNTGYNTGIRLKSVADWYIFSGGSLGASGRLSFLNNTSGNTNLYLENDGTSVFTGNIKFGGGTKSSDGSTGISTTVTTASLVGKTITFKDGLVTAFA